MANGKMGNPQQVNSGAWRRGLGRALLATLLASTAATAMADEILRPRDKAAFEAELKALQEKYGVPDAATAEGGADTAIAVAVPSAQAAPAAQVAAADEPAAEPSVIVVDTTKPGRALDAAAPTPAATDAPSATPTSAAAPMFPGTLLQPRRKDGVVAQSTPESDRTAGAPPPSSAATVLQADETDVARSPRSTAQDASPAAADAAPALQFSGTMLTPRGGAARAETAAAPSAPVSGDAAMPTRRLSPPSGANRGDEMVGVPALRIALLPVGQKQFLLREQIYDAESLEIYLRKLDQPIDSVVLLAEADHIIELGHLVALGQLSRTLRVPTLYQQGGNLRALSVR